MSSFWKKLSLLIVLFTLSGTLAACSSQKKATTSQTKPIHVVASLDFYGEVAQAVLGDHGTVTTIIKSPSIDPHDFDPTPKTHKRSPQPMWFFPTVSVMMLGCKNS
ncbi:zinc ABC transporter substrate-binding protein [Levilactobacillus brevis]|nr:zinc ABC transporter substrate-binding protein [Levilactobacillus brevis]